MRKHIYGQIWGVLQLGFWVIMIPWIIIAIPVDLWAESIIKSQPDRLPEEIQAFFLSPWVDWRWGLVILGVFYILLISVALIWGGWQRMHPLSTNNNLSQTEIALERYQAVQNFSKEKYLKKIREDAHVYRLEREKARLKRHRILKKLKSGRFR